MTQTRRTLLTAATAAMLAGSLPLVAVAQSYPEQPIRIFVGFPPGGSTDTIGRMIAEGLGAQLGQNVIVENVPGAGSNIAAHRVARADPDGYTLLLATAGTHAINASIYPDMPFDHIEDFAPVASVATSANVLIVRPDFPATTLEAFVEMVSAGDERVTVAIPGNGSTPHMTTELLNRATGGNLTHVNYPGGGPALVDLMAGRVDMLFEGTMSAAGHIEAGSVMPLGISSPERNELLPDVPAIGEVIDGFEAGAWWGLVAPAGTPESVIATLNEAANAALSTDALQARFADLGASTGSGSAADFARHIVDETAKWSAIIEEAGVTLE